jgi:alginate O-acetyltransferase complex protein AlgI
MLFNSFGFIFLYLPITFFLFFFVAKKSHFLAALWLAVASLVFYGLWNPKFTFLLLASIVFNYSIGYLIGHAQKNPQRSKNFLIMGISINLALLIFFKYTNFFIATVNDLGNFSLPLTHIILPLGISFFTFTQIAFLVDVHKGIAKEYNFIHYVLFVTYFPHLIAGPILHHKQMMPQFDLKTTYRLSLDNVGIGLTIFAVGLAKKVLLADNIAPFANTIFKSVHGGTEPQFIAAWTGALAYTFQLYFDFSGYSDMAVGLARMFNVNLPLNFNSPYKAWNIIEFWRRWHMTLSQFLRDYLYIPLGGNRLGPIRRYLNLFITMLLGGLWHGASWTFVVWGGLHGIFLAINHGWQALKLKLGFYPHKDASLLQRAVNVTLTFVVVVIAWVFFRADNITTALHMLKGMTGLNGFSLAPTLQNKLNFLQSFGVTFKGFLYPVSMSVYFKDIVLFFVLFCITFLMPNAQEIVLQDHKSSITWRPTMLWALTIGILLAICILSFENISEFLYFQF